MIKHRIVELLTELKIRPSEFARNIKLSKSTLSDVMTGKSNNISSSTLANIQEVYNVNTGWLISGNGQMFRYSPKTEQIVKDRKESIFDLAEELDEFEHFIEHLRKIYVEIPTAELRTEYLQLIKKLEKNFFKWDEIAKYLDSL